MNAQSASKNHLSLKWGKLKSWNFEGNEKALNLLEEYDECDDADKLRQIICDLIDCSRLDKIYLEWDAVYVTKAKAKRYVMEYIV